MTTDIPDDDFETVVDPRRWRDSISQHLGCDLMLVDLVAHKLMERHRPHVVDMMLDAVAEGLGTWDRLGRPIFRNAFQSHCFLAYLSREDRFFNHLLGEMGDDILDARDAGRRTWAEIARGTSSIWEFASTFRCFDPSFHDHWPRAGESGYRECVNTAARSFERMFLAKPTVDKSREGAGLGEIKSPFPVPNPPALDAQALLTLANTKAVLTFEAEAKVMGVPADAIMLCCAFPSHISDGWVESIKYFYELWQNFGSPEYFTDTELESFLCFGVRKRSMEVCSAHQQLAECMEYNNHAIRLFAEYMSIYFIPLNPFARIFKKYRPEYSAGFHTGPDLLKYLEEGEQEFVCGWDPEEYLNC